MHVDIIEAFLVDNDMLLFQCWNVLNWLEEIGRETNVSFSYLASKWFHKSLIIIIF
jgi:hypothetical protein